jgi:hypothetical protein
MMDSRPRVRLIVPMLLSLVMSVLIPNALVNLTGFTCERFALAWLFGLGGIRRGRGFRAKAIDDSVYQGSF